LNIVIVKNLNRSLSGEVRIRPEHPALRPARGVFATSLQDQDNGIEIHKASQRLVFGLPVTARISPDGLGVAITNRKSHQLLPEQRLKPFRKLLRL